jgi:predicted acetyltransferase
VILRQLSLLDRASFETFLDQWEDSSGLSLIYGLVAGLDFGSYLKIINEARDGIHLGSHEVPTTSLFAFVDGHIVGKVSIRHDLNSYFEITGGHVGFGVLSEYRGRGFATQILASALEYCRNIGLKKILLTCEESNVNSQKVIIRNGGVLDHLSDPKQAGAKILRYWIKL